MPIPLGRDPSELTVNTGTTCTTHCPEYIGHFGKNKTNFTGSIYILRSMYQYVGEKSSRALSVEPRGASETLWQMKLIFWHLQN